MTHYYTTVSCPNCKKFLAKYYGTHSRNFPNDGCPFIICPNCRTEVIDRGCIENAISYYKKMTRERRNALRAEEKTKTAIDSLNGVGKKLSSELSESMKRLSNYEYVRKLLSYQFEVPDFFIDRFDKKGAQELYNIRDSIENQRKKDYAIILQEQKKYELALHFIKEGIWGKDFVRAAKEVGATPEQLQEECYKTVVTFKEIIVEYNRKYVDPVEYPLS